MDSNNRTTRAWLTFSGKCYQKNGMRWSVRIGRMGGRGSKEAVLGRRKNGRRIEDGGRRKRVRFVVHSVGVSFEWQIDNWSLLSYDWALLSRYFCVHSSPHLLFGPLPWTLSETSSAAPCLGYRLRGSQVTRVTWTPAASVAHSSLKIVLAYAIRPESGLLFLHKTKW